MNLAGKPCEASPLIPERWDGPEEITGLYCLAHEGSIATETRIHFQQTGTAIGSAYRRLTPGELAHELIQRAPKFFLKPHLKALGLELTDDGEFHEKGTGLKLHGFSRGGEVIRSPYPDYVGQVNVAEKLLDRVYGKARQSMDLASSNTTVAVNVDLSPDRVSRVTDILTQIGAFGGDDGIIEGSAVDLDATPAESEEK